jgi:DNA polymerase elongation subunit (family B)|tara:strand:- start:22584 stop:25154 length:2571 start_codon:yes stop_codon:yes gene_type:complete
MSEFYTNISMRGKNILYRGIDENGNRVSRKEEFNPTLFIPTKSKTEWMTLDGYYVEPIKPGNIPDTREFLNTYKNVSGFDIYGNTDYVCQYVAENFENEIDYDISKIVVANIDIECESEHGFPDIEDAQERVNAISVDFNGKMYVLGLGVFNLSANDVHYQEQFTHEEDLLKAFLDLWEQESPDIVTGWNVRFFDIPYLINRIKVLFGNKEARRMSPWKELKDRKVEKFNRENQVYELIGIATLDYFELYKTFTYVNQASYALNHIAQVELGEKKLDYSEYDSMSDFYKNDFQKFMEYNVLDTRLVMKLEDKMKLLELAITLAYSAKLGNYMDVFGQLRTWDSIIYHFLHEHKIAIPPKREGKKTSQYAGAYVKEPIVGMHDWVVSFDLASLYPSIIRWLNLSPETKTDDGFRKMFGVDSILNNNDIAMEMIKKSTDKGLCVAANGTTYSKEHQGFLPAIMEKLYNERKMYKKKMIEAQKHRQDVGTMAMPTLAKGGVANKLDKEITKYHNFQLVRKIQLNSCYGALGNEYGRYYDIDLAEAITLSGQLIIQFIADKLNEFLNKTFKTGDYDYVVASDTDSVYLRCGNLVDKVCPSTNTKQEMVEFLHKASEEIILPFIEKQYAELSETMGAMCPEVISMEREVIADKAVWTAKKRYMMRVFDSEGVRYDPPKQKIMGIETTRSSTPQVVRDSLKEAINLILTTDEDTVIKFIDDFRDKFETFSVEEIAFPRGVKGLDKYSSRGSIYKKSTPIAVKGSLIYNHYVDKFDIGKKYRKIINGDKIKFVHLKSPNPVGGVAGQDQVIAFPNELPKEFELESFIDYDHQFEKAFLNPLKTILEKIGWNWEEVSTLEGLFV